MRSIQIVAFCAVLLLAACKKEEQGNGTLGVQIGYKVDQKAFVFDSKDFTCEAGYPYEISKLEYYLSAFSMKDSKGNIYTSDIVFYLNAKRSETNLLTFSDIPVGDYTDLYFTLGLDTTHNKTNVLEATVDNTNMSWPDMMGGGYHFMKLEGFFTNSSTNTGFAMHLGRNGNAVKIHLAKLFTIKSNQTNALNLTMNINEWFKNPSVYDFVTDGQYSMSNMPAMQKLSVNGVDVFN
jgi:hypothetical protein